MGLSFCRRSSSQPSSTRIEMISCNRSIPVVILFCVCVCVWDWRDIKSTKALVYTRKVSVKLGQGSKTAHFDRKSLDPRNYACEDTSSRRFHEYKGKTSRGDGEEAKPGLRRGISQREVYDREQPTTRQHCFLAFPVNSVYIVALVQS